jgi:hypothetical protein
MNPILTQLAKTRHALFVEGMDFNIIGKFAQKCGANDVGNRRDFSVVPVHGFNPDRIRNLKSGMEASLGSPIISAVILDRDYRSSEECAAIISKCRAFCEYVVVLSCKEIENLLLVPSAIDRAVAKRVEDRARRSESVGICSPFAGNFLSEFCESRKNYVFSQSLTEHRRFLRSQDPSIPESTLSERALGYLTNEWSSVVGRLRLVPGKDALSAVNAHIQERYGVSVTPAAIIDAMRANEIPPEVSELISMLRRFASTTFDGRARSSTEGS